MNDLRQPNNKKLVLESLQKGLAPPLFYRFVALVSAFLFLEAAFAAAKFDVDAGIVAATTPLVTALKAHWGKGVLLTGGASALIGEGDARQRALRAAIGCGASGAVVLALIAMLS